MASSNKTLSDAAVLAGFGQVAISNIVQSSGYTLFYGMFAIIYIQSLVTYFKTSHPSPARLRMLLICTFTFFLATAREVTLLGGLGITIHSKLIEHQDLPLADKSRFSAGPLKKQAMVAVLAGNLSIIISDSIVVWRAFILLQRRRLLITLPLLTLLGTTASFFALFGLILTGGNMHGTTTSAVLVSKLGAAELSLSLITNVVTTAFIGYVFWIHRKDMIVGLRNHRPTQGERVLAMLVESGVVFCLPQAIYFILGIFPAFEKAGSGGLYAQLVFEAIYFGFAAMYPTVVIALVNSHQTFDHMYLSDTSLTVMQQHIEPDCMTTLQFTTSSSATSVGTI
ncbi:hypothetical protein BDZ94DRAFT_1316655 [Collybia nuda]|uniref:Uncharacterized protein n=1 Tax=Collybia nuda TaxID=64659 RepID=A0A9P5YIX0_9AGAR|nr:hypothetical protein BDZ94DRAFT_1316655 [Collybia nuda]